MAGRAAFPQRRYEPHGMEHQSVWLRSQLPGKAALDRGRVSLPARLDVVRHGVGAVLLLVYEWVVWRVCTWN